MAQVPTISACMPNYNHARLLPESLGALLHQSHQPLEIIVIDDHSTDDSMVVLEDLAGRHPVIRLHRNERNLGGVETLARLTELARGDYVLYTGADDVTLPGLLEKSAAMLGRYPQAGLCSSGMIVIDEGGRSKGVLHHSIAARSARYFTPEEIRELIAELGYEGWFFAANTAVYKRQAVIEAGGFRNELHAFCDGFLSTAIALKYGACHIPEPLGAWRRAAVSYGTSWGDPDIAPGIVDAVERVISADFQDLFPQSYVGQMRRVVEVKLRLGERGRRDRAARERLAQTRLGRSPLAPLVLAALARLQAVRAGLLHVSLRIRLGLPVRTRLAWKVKDLIGAVRPPQVPRWSDLPSRGR